MPYFGGGLLGFRQPPSMVQPVYVKDVAREFVDAIVNPKTFGQTYGLCGRQPLTWPLMHYIVSEVFTGKRKAALAHSRLESQDVDADHPGVAVAFHAQPGRHGVGRQHLRYEPVRRGFRVGAGGV